jgi:hypothetical protein
MESLNYAFIGDIHSQAGPLAQALQHCRENGLTPILLGDLFDSRLPTSQSVEVYQMARRATEEGGIVLRSNHQNKFERYARGNNVIIHPDFGSTLSDLEEGGITVQEVAEWLDTFPYGIAFRDSRGTEYRCAHAFFPDRLLVPRIYDGVYCVETVSRSARDLMLFGPRRPGTEWPQDETRVFWWEEEEDSDRDWVRVAGHYHAVFIGRKSLVLDGEMGGSTHENFNPDDAYLCLWDVEAQTLSTFR